MKNDGPNKTSEVFHSLEAMEERELVPGDSGPGRGHCVEGGARWASVGGLSHHRRLFPSCAALLCLACGGDSNATPGTAGDLPDAASVDAWTPQEAGPDLPEDVTDATEAHCTAEDNVEVVADDAAQQIQVQMEKAGYVRLTAGGTEVSVTAVEADRVQTSRTEDAAYFDAEADILALPAEDRMREAYEGGDIPKPDWTTEGLLSLLRLEPYTDVQLFHKDDELVVQLVRLEACLSSHLPPDPEPHELVRRWVHRVPKATTLETRVESRTFLVQSFEREDGWDAHPNSPLIERSGGAGFVVDWNDTYQLWVNAYSGATGLLFRGTSDDGVVWDFAWDAAHQCTFEGVDEFTRKRDPAVVVDQDKLVMWVEIEDGAPATRIHRTESTDGLAWAAPVRIQGDDMRDFRAPWVMRHEGAWYMFGHDWGERNVVHATSDDGLNWLHRGVAVDRGETIDDIDGFGAFTPAVYHDDSRWVLVYAAAYSPRELIDHWHQQVWHQMHLAYATSDDGLTWTKSPKPLWSQQRTRGHWESGNIGRPIALRHGEDRWVYYTGVERGEPSVGLIVGVGW